MCGIEYLLSELDVDADREIEFLHPARLTIMPPHIEIAVFRVVQELLSNACRHSQAKKIRVQLTQDAGGVQIEVRDWGLGFDPNKVTENVCGLQSLHESGSITRWRIDIDAAPDSGTRVFVEFPLDGRYSSNSICSRVCLCVSPLRVLGSLPMRRFETHSHSFP